MVNKASTTDDSELKLLMFCQQNSNLQPPGQGQMTVSPPIAADQLPRAPASLSQPELQA